MRGVNDLRFQVLGPVRAWRGATEVDIGARKPRAVLAVLLLNADRPVDVDTIARFVWDDAAPAGVSATVHTYVAGLRGALDPGRPARSRSGLISSSYQGYRLRVDADRVDAFRCRRLVAQAQTHWFAGRTAAAAEPLAAALALFHGPPLAGLGDGARGEALMLEQLRVGAGTLAVAVALATRETAAWLPALAELAVAAPLDEPLQAGLMRVYQQAGRRAEALAVFDRTRRALRDELGIGPGEPLRTAVESVLNDDLLVTAR